MAAFLMSEEVEYINGEVIAIDSAMGIMGNGTFSNSLMEMVSPTDWSSLDKPWPPPDSSPNNSHGCRKPHCAATGSRPSSNGRSIGSKPR